MAKRLKISLLPEWLNISRENPDGPLTFIRDGLESPGVLQISVQAEYVGGKPPNPTVGDLISFARSLGERNEAGDVIEERSGSCAIGQYGTAIFRSQEYPHLQLWVLSNGLDFVLATFTCPVEPSPEELQDIEEIVSLVDFR